VSAVETADVKRLHNSLSKTPYQANRVLSLLSKMFTFGMEAKMRPDNPAKGIKRFTEDKREQWFTVDQLHAFSDALDAYPEQDAADALRLLIVTGARPHEVLGARWEQFDLKRRVWTKPSHHTKERKTEHVPLNDAALFILRRMEENKDGIYLFPGRDTGNDGEPTARTTLRNAWKQVCKSAGFATVTYKKGKRGKPLRRWKPIVRVYDFRHTFASHLVSSGQSLPMIGRLMGHTQTSTTKRYAHIADSALREATNKFPDVLTIKRLA
jgi:integrase